MSWDILDNSNQNNSSDNKMEFVKFPVGVTQLRIIGVPLARWTHWIAAQKRSINCPGRGCPICHIISEQKKQGEKSTYNSVQRFTWLALNRATERAEYVDQGKKFFEEMRDLRAEHFKELGEMDNYDVKVRRRGTGQDDTSYRVDVVGESPLTELEKEILSIAIPVAEYFKPHSFEQITRIIGGETFEEVMKSQPTESNEKIELE